jgi:multiple sugar transport system permease protein
MSRAARRRAARAILLGATAALLLLWVFPIVWAIVVSLKDEAEVLAWPPSVVFAPTLENYADALVGRFSILPNLWSSVVIASATTAITVCLAVPAAYAFARLKLRGKQTIGFYTLATQMIPPIGTI